MQALEHYPFQHFPNYFNSKGLKEKILQQIPLQSDKILIGRGSETVEVEERRQTAWLSNNYNLTFEYSGKSMLPRKIPTFIESIRIQLLDDFGIDFDGILVNYYQNGDCSMGYHSDPLEDKWTTDFIILSIGASRDFIFRNQETRDLKIKFNFTDGDLIYMFDTCQNDYEHCVKKNKSDTQDRISLVFKKSKI